jgi:hypothetical protein
VRRLDAAFDGAARRTAPSSPASFNSRLFLGRLNFNLNDPQNEGRKEAQMAQKLKKKQPIHFALSETFWGYSFLNLL